jgi:hypothetical protein
MLIKARVDDGTTDTATAEISCTSLQTGVIQNGGYKTFELKAAI